MAFSPHSGLDPPDVRRIDPGNPENIENPGFPITDFGNDKKAL